MARDVRSRTAGEGDRAPRRHPQTVTGTQERKGLGYQDAEPQRVPESGRAQPRTELLTAGRRGAGREGGGPAQGVTARPPPAGRGDSRREGRRAGGRGAALAARRHFEARGAEGEESPAEVGAGSGAAGRRAGFP